MIWLTRIDGEQIMLNEDQILFIEVPHDTLIVLSTGDRIRVLETADEIADRVAHWRRRVTGLELLAGMDIEPEGPN